MTSSAWSCSTGLGRINSRLSCASPDSQGAGETPLNSLPHPLKGDSFLCCLCLHSSPDFFSYFSSLLLARILWREHLASELAPPPSSIPHYPTPGPQPPEVLLLAVFELLHGSLRGPMVCVPSRDTCTSGIKLVVLRLNIPDEGGLGGRCTIL